MLGYSPLPTPRSSLPLFSHLLGNVSDQRAIVEELAGAAARGESVVLASVVRTVGSAYRGVGTRMLVRADDRAVGLVSGGCLEADLIERARHVRATGQPEVVTYDTLSDDELVWGLGIGCNGLVELLVEPLAPARAGAVAALLGGALDGTTPAVLATVVRSDAPGGPAIGARLLARAGTDEPLLDGAWGREIPVDDVLADAAQVAGGAWRGTTRDYALADGRQTQLSFEVVVPTVRLTICGSGPDAVPVARLASNLGWTVTVVDHRPTALAHAERFPDARVVECADATRLADLLSFESRSAVVVMSHHYGRDLDYLDAILAVGGAGYVGLLGPRSRTDRMLADLAARGRSRPPETFERLFGPVGLDVGGEGPEAIALAIVAEVSAVMSGRGGGHLREREGPIHAPMDNRASGERFSVGG